MSERITIKHVEGTLARMKTIWPEACGPEGDEWEIGAAYGGYKIETPLGRNPLGSGYYPARELYNMLHAAMDFGFLLAKEAPWQKTDWEGQGT
jgi:hypothetical protein